MSATSDIIDSIRELSFDRFVTPCFYVQSDAPGLTISISSSSLSIIGMGSPPSYSLVLPFSTYPTLKSIVDALIGAGFRVSYSASYILSEASSSLLPTSSQQLTPPVYQGVQIQFPVYRKFFFGDTAVMKVIRKYFVQMLRWREQYGTYTITDQQVEGTLAALHQPTLEHLSLWCAYKLVDNRRVYELSGEFLNQSSLTENGYSGILVDATGSSQVSVNIADVFSVTDNNTDNYNQGELPYRPGADNVLGDAQSFWYRLMLWLRKMVEDDFGDNSLRSATVIEGRLILHKDINFYAYFDSYPYTLSPLVRGLTRSTNWGLQGGLLR
jgi:hypothetical protein